MDNNIFDRRMFLKSLVAVGVCSALPPVAFAKTQSANIFVWITLRGAMDGLNVVVPYGDKDYLPQRPSIGLHKNQLNKLDDFFGLHPALKSCYQWYQLGEMAFIHACASPYRQRSHFDGQKVLENGTEDPLHRDGWLNRFLSVDRKQHTIAIDSGLPLIVQGNAQADSWYPHKLKIKQQQAELLQEMYQSDQTLSDNFINALDIEKMAGHVKGGQQFHVLAQQAGKFLTSENGPNIAVLELGGWDTHAGEGAVKGRLASQLKKLDDGLSALKVQLGEAWSRTVVIAASEFGRTVAENGTKGTDHGTANAMLIAGGAVSGKKVITKWPGLAKSQQYKGRDLAPTTDIRSICKTVLHSHLGATNKQLDIVFPSSSELPVMNDLIRNN
ncbi:DUF1501 domain-containing protein [Photobacterium angustum]|uniref:DUF1501 domain-containing protein n=1 Tax=Photobacterium angustum TaxID=661 RepID=UPI000D168C55|nr:DUF1501 domain-containing protein [Photobacterium angustum]PSV67204.1 Tat pathway signal protein [Photobacterium angustum]